MKLSNIDEVKSPVSMVVSQMESVDILEKINSKIASPFTKLPANLCFAKTTSNAILFTGEYMEIYIPANDLGRNTILSGQEITTFGIFPMNIWIKKQDEYINTNPEYETRYMLPVKIVTNPSAISKKTISLHDMPSEPYLVLSYSKDSVFIKNTQIIKSSKTVSDFVDMIIKAFIPSVVKYDEFVPMVLECCKLNGVDFGVNSTTLEMIIAAQARSKNDETMPYRLVIDKDPNAEMDFIKMSQIPHVTSTFTSFAFQDIDYAITVSANRNRTKETQTISDVEEMLKY